MATTSTSAVGSGHFSRMIHELSGAADPDAPAVLPKSDTPARPRITPQNTDDQRRPALPADFPELPAGFPAVPVIPTAPTLPTAASILASLRGIANQLPADIAQGGSVPGQPVKQPEGPGNDLPAHTRINSGKRDLSPTLAMEGQIPVFPVPVALPSLPSLPPLPVRLLPAGQGGAHEKSLVDLSPAQDATPPERLVQTDTVLQLRLRTQGPIVPSPVLPVLPDLRTMQELKAPQQPATGKTREPDQRNSPSPANGNDATVEPAIPEKTKSSPVAVPVAAAHTAFASQQADPATLAASPSPPASDERASAPTSDAPTLPPVRSVPETPALSPTAHLQEPVMDQKASQPIRSVALEFAPDGAGDVRLRVSERAGEVHISLHSQDGALSGRLHEGVQELVGSLSRAGYEAEAWTSGQGRQNQRPPQDDEKPKRNGSSDASGSDDFSSIFTPSEQEK